MHTLGRTFYVKGSVLPFEEDQLTEFKGHRNVAASDVPDWVFSDSAATGRCSSSRKCVSRNLNAFLNSGRGGTVYCGVDDAGRVLGMHLTRYQRDHVLLAVRDTLQRYRPPVPWHRYRVRFVPVLELSDAGRVPSITVDCNSGLRSQPHRVSTAQYCWCDADAKARSQSGMFPLEYVIEIEIAAWRGAGCNSLTPFFLAENGKCYLRFQGSVRPISVLECIQYTQQQAQSVCRHWLCEMSACQSAHRQSTTTTAAAAAAAAAAGREWGGGGVSLSHTSTGSAGQSSVCECATLLRAVSLADRSDHSHTLSATPAALPPTAAATATAAADHTVDVDGDGEDCCLMVGPMAISSVASSATSSATSRAANVSPVSAAVAPSPAPHAAPSHVSTHRSAVSSGDSAVELNSYCDSSSG